MKSLNDALREEFTSALNDDEIQYEINSRQIDKKILKDAFNVLLRQKQKKDDLDGGRKELENYLINYFRTKKFNNDADK